MITEQQYREYISSFMEVINASDLEALDKLADTYIASEYISHLPGVSDPVRGPEGVKQWFRWVAENIPGYHSTVEDIFAIGDKGAVRFTGHRTDPVTGKAQCITSLMISHFKDGKSVEEWKLAGEWEDEV